MLARVKEGAPNTICTAFGGIEFVWYEWRPVPAGAEAAAEVHPYLELKADDPPPVLAVDLDELTVNELKTLAKERELSGYSNLSKAELIDLLRDD